MIKKFLFLSAFLLASYTFSQELSDENTKKETQRIVIEITAHISDHPALIVTDSLEDEHGINQISLNHATLDKSTLEPQKEVKTSSRKYYIKRKGNAPLLQREQTRVTGKFSVHRENNILKLRDSKGNLVNSTLIIQGLDEETEKKNYRTFIITSILNANSLLNKKIGDYRGSATLFLEIQ